MQAVDHGLDRWWTGVVAVLPMPPAAAAVSWCRPSVVTACDGDDCWPPSSDGLIVGVKVATVKTSAVLSTFGPADAT